MGNGPLLVTLSIDLAKFNTQVNIFRPLAEQATYASAATDVTASRGPVNFHGRIRAAQGMRRHEPTALDESRSAF